MNRIKVVILLLMVSILFAGCTGKDAVMNEEKPITVTIWHYYNGKQKKAFDILLEKFNQTVGEEKGIIVTAESKGEVVNLQNCIMSAAEKKVGSERLPDIFATYTDTAIRIHKMGLLADISEYMTEEELKEYNPIFLDEGSFTKGSLQIFPVAKATELLYLNKTDWDRFAEDKGYDLSQLTAWEGIREAAEAYYEWSGGKTFFGRDASANFMLVGFHQLGKDIFQESGENVNVILEESILKKIWDNYGQPYIEGYYGAFGRFRSDDLKTGDIVAVVASTSSVGYYPKEVTLDNGNTYPIDVVVLPLPDFYGTKKSSVQQGAGMAVVKSSTQKEKAAIEFLKWFTDVEQNISFCIDTGYFPVKTDDGIKEQMKEIMKRMGTLEKSLVYENTMLGLEAILSTELYSPMPFEEGSIKRSIITKYLTEELENYKKDYNEISSEDRESFLEGCYEKWSVSLIKELEN
ncbi:MAG TPA: ABC transporter substrate-binding protein [Clostridiales bacterium]|nr:ABC transporter substrate-binding protein [Clostridiales bacterium]